MHARHSVLKVTGFTVALLALAVTGSARAAASGPDQEVSRHHHTSGAAKDGAETLVAIVRAATERFKNVEVAKAEGYALQFGCVTGPDAGAMGLHYVNGALVGDGVIDATRPEIILYEPTPSGGVNLVGADYLVLADAWNKTHSTAPELNGQLFHLFEAPNRFGLPSFYTLHVWAWKESPTGTFVNWHSKVSCDVFTGK